MTQILKIKQDQETMNHRMLILIQLRILLQVKGIIIDNALGNKLFCNATQFFILFNFFFGTS